MSFDARPSPGGTTPAPRPLGIELLVDAEWYRRQYPDVADRDPLTHYLETGWREGRDPGPLFDTDWYTATYPEAAAAPLPHFLANGPSRLLRPNPLLDPDWYARTHPLVREQGWDPVTHYIAVGRQEGLAPGPAVAAVAAHPARHPPGELPSVTVVVPAGADLVHVDRCIRALAATEVPLFANVAVLTTAAVPPPWQQVYPWLRVVGSAPPDDPMSAVADVVAAARADFVLVLSPHSEPVPGFLHALVAEHHSQSVAENPSPVVIPCARASLVAPDLPGDWGPLADASLPAEAALVAAADWPSALAAVTRPVVAGDCAAALAARSCVTAPDAWVITHRPMVLAQAVRTVLPRWTPGRTPGLVLQAAQAEFRVGVPVMLAWLQLAACDMAAADTSLSRWRTAVATLSPAERAALPRLIRRRDQLVAEILQEAALAPAAAERANAAIRQDDEDAAVRNLRDCPGSYPAAVAVMTLAAAERPADPGTRAPGVPRVIVQGWFDSPVPDDARRMAQTWVGHHPGWQHLLFDTGTAAAWIRRELGPHAESVFRTASPVGKSNLFRYAYLSVAGGVWSDIDDSCVAPLDPLVTGSSFVMLRESLGAVADNIIAVTPGHPALVATRQEAFANVHEGFAESQWLANGPGLFTRKVAAWVAGDLPVTGAPGDYRVVSGLRMSEFVAVHGALSYKETSLAWDVPDDPAQLRATPTWGHPTPLSRRQRLLAEGCS